MNFFLYGVNSLSFTTTCRIEHLEIPAFFSIFVTLPCRYRSDFFSVAETLVMVQTASTLSTWNRFYRRLCLTHETVSKHCEPFSCFAISLLLTPAVLRTTIWSTLAMSVITCRILKTNEWRLGWALINIQRFDSENFKDFRCKVREIFALENCVILSWPPCKPNIRRLRFRPEVLIGCTYHHWLKKTYILYFTG